MGRHAIIIPEIFKKQFKSKKKMNEEWQKNLTRLRQRRFNECKDKKKKGYALLKRGRKKGSQIIPPLVQRLHDANQKITKLETENSELKGDIKRLRRDNLELSHTVNTLAQH